jgi:hypothetical protein
MPMAAAPANDAITSSHWFGLSFAAVSGVMKRMATVAINGQTNAMMVASAFAAPYRAR